MILDFRYAVRFILPRRKHEVEPRLELHPKRFVTLEEAHKFAQNRTQGGGRWADCDYEVLDLSDGA